MLDTTFAARAPYSGTAVYLERLQDALSRLPGVEVVAASNGRRRPPAGGGVGSARNLLTDRWWAMVELPRLASRSGAEVIHHPLPAVSRATRIPQVVTVHDLSFERLPQCFDRRFRRYAHRSHQAAARAAAAVICVSETTAREVSDLWNVPSERVVIARHGPGQEAAPWIPPHRPTPYLLYVGDDEPRKNLGVLLAAYARYRFGAASPLGLVLAGSARAVAAGARIEPHPAPERLAALYRGAVALVHPSLYEGFGLTVLEAMSAGTPVIAARSPGVLEVCGDAARYADAGDPASFAAAITEIADMPALREDLAQRGTRRSADFSWAASARAHLAAYAMAARSRSAYSLPV